jgi:insulysin
MYQMTKLMAAPEHPFSKFGTGNLLTLKTTPEAKGINVRDALLKFHDEHVSANNMRLVVVGRDSVEVLSAMIERMFAPVKNLDLPVPYPPPGLSIPPFGTEQLGFRYNMVPVSDHRGLKMIFPTPAFRQHYQSKPSRYASNLIGHEGLRIVFHNLSCSSLSLPLSLVAGSSASRSPAS